MRKQKEKWVNNSWNILIITHYIVSNMILNAFIYCFNKYYLRKINIKVGFSCGSAGKESACNARDPSSIPELGRSLGEGDGNPLQYSCLEIPKDRRSLAVCSPWGDKESNMTEWLTHTCNIKGRIEAKTDECAHDIIQLRGEHYCITKQKFSIYYLNEFAEL